MKTTVDIRIYNRVDELPKNWDDLACKNIFLTKKYLTVLELSKPSNMFCNFIGLFQENILVGISIAQLLDLNKLSTFGAREKCIKTTVRNIFFNKLCSKILIIGNNMVTGQNAYAYSNTITEFQVLTGLKTAATLLCKIYKSKGIQVHITTYKDFPQQHLADLQQNGFQNYHLYSTQPNMRFEIQEHWKSERNYIDALSKKYRDQYKRARKKAASIEKRKMDLSDIIQYEDIIYDLYLYVAKNAFFNTFYIQKKHFRIFKEVLQDKFLFYGYFLEGQLIGFNTLIKNGDVIETYFLGYDGTIQKEKMLYLNMLYDMVVYSITQGFKEIVFARTALEIKSSIGAKPEKIYGFAKHSNPIADLVFDKAYNYLEPKVEWQERNPYK